RTPVRGGGAPPRHLIALSLYGQRWILLNRAQRDRVRTAEAHQYKWLNRLSLHAVFSSHCLKTVRLSDPSSTLQPCTACWSVKSLKAFKNALRHETPDEENLKFVPHEYREKELGDLYLRYHGLAGLVKTVRIPYFFVAKMLSDFARGVLSGVYKDHEVLLGAIKAIVTTKQRDAQGKSMRGMQYPSAFD
ncbi:hypothetical protein EXIGLDRAFT_595025, partial [Exidia glandulosa HHB12029]